MQARSLATGSVSAWAACRGEFQPAPLQELACRRRALGQVVMGAEPDGIQEYRRCRSLGGLSGNLPATPRESATARLIGSNVCQGWALMRRIEEHKVASTDRLEPQLSIVML